MSEIKAVIFDLDGTLLDNNEVHLKAWKKYLKDSGMEISDEDFKENISGRTNKDAVSHIYKKDMKEDEASKYYLKKEEIYRKMYKKNIAPIAGLHEFLENLHNHNVTMAIATSGIQVNIDFMFEHVPIKKYFKEIISSGDITKGKPDPQIFTKTAAALHIARENCIVFEDSMPGVKAGKAAGMKVVALTTSHNPEELQEADMIIKDYTEITFDRLMSLSQ
ncbi:HAD family hydrolase [Segetibacter koreensis]|uniref:HAD family hydrolase n=1 Tax=Segetibacter koreensis TaxID=398037 RepID=UPI00036CDDF9|nr:HAD family phosphatase [Segetibacter koreensis]